MTQDALHAAGTAWHVERRGSVSLISLHLHGFYAGARGRSLRESPYYVEPPSVTILFTEWRAAHAAGIEYMRELTLVLT